MLTVGLTILALIALAKMRKGVSLMLSEYTTESWFSTLILLSQRYDFPLSVLQAQIWAESRGNPLARSSVNAQGLLQVTPIVLDEYKRETKSKVSDLFDPYVNLTIGVWYLARLRDHYHQRTLYNSLLAYANGLGNIRAGTLPHPDYATLVLRKANVIA